MLIANKPCRAIQTFYQLFFPVTWYDTVLWYYPECSVTDKWECITGSFSVWASVWHSDRVQDLHRAPFVWCWCLSLPLRAPGLLSYALMPVELYYIKICNKNNIPAITAGGVVQSDALIANSVEHKHIRAFDWCMHVTSVLGSDVTDGCLHHVHIQAWQRQSAELFASEIPSSLLHHGGRARQTWLLIDRSDCCSGREQNGLFPWRLVAGFGVYLWLPGHMLNISLP